MVKIENDLSPSKEQANELIYDLNINSASTVVNRNVYTPVRMGDQIWLDENLNSTTFLNGDAFAKGTDARYC
jgi:hypothetical protein